MSGKLGYLESYQRVLKTPKGFPSVRNSFSIYNTLLHYLLMISNELSTSPSLFIVSLLLPLSFSLCTQITRDKWGSCIRIVAPVNGKINSSTLTGPQVQMVVVLCSGPT